MTLKGLAELIQTGQPIDLVDVCSPSDYREAHIEGAQNVPLRQLDATAMAAEHLDAEKEPVYVIGRSGTQSHEACEKLAVAGAAIVVHVKGKAPEWEAAGLPVVHGSTSLSLDPQITILAGTLVLAGSALAVLVHPAWGAVPASVGVFLIYSGFMDK